MDFFHFDVVSKHQKAIELNICLHLESFALIFFLLLRHPIQTLRPLFLLLLVEAAVVVWGAGVLMDLVEARAIDRPRIEHVVALFGIVQGAALWRHLTSGAKYIAAARVSLHLVPPHKKKGNPWQTIGGPGGPQYPVGDSEDEYHVAM